MARTDGAQKDKDAHIGVAESAQLFIDGDSERRVGRIAGERVRGDEVDEERRRAHLASSGGRALDGRVPVVHAVGAIAKVGEVAGDKGRVGDGRRRRKELRREGGVEQRVVGRVGAKDANLTRIINARRIEEKLKFRQVASVLHKDI